VRNTRPISWVKAARKAFEKFPAGAQDQMLDALSVAAEGHAFQKKGKKGRKTPKQEIDLVRDRLRRLKKEFGS
jgi:phage-related protein